VNGGCHVFMKCMIDEDNGRGLIIIINKKDQRGSKLLD
jgi:hypothetical protein